MKFKFIFIIIFLSNCTINTTKLENRTPFNSKGFALIFKDVDYDNKIVKGKLDNSKLQIAHRDLETKYPCEDNKSSNKRFYYSKEL